MKVILSGGGTGGHIYPAVSIAKEILNNHKDAEIIFVGTEKGLESKIIPNEGFELKKIKVRGFERRLSFANLIALKEVAASFFDVKKIIKDFKPDIVIGTGGYVCGSLLITAALMHIPTLIHEQNAFPGVTNKLLSRFVDKVALNFEEAKKYFANQSKLFVTGNPIRNEMLNISKPEGLKAFGFSADFPLVFVVGGSRGAKRINECITPIVMQCIQSKSFQLLHMTGETQYGNVVRAYEEKGIPLDTKYLKVVPYLHNIPYALAASDLIISRCGASTLSEITLLGKPAVLIPFPYATDNHQEYNARALEKNGAAIVIIEKELNESILSQTVLELLSHPEQLKEMGDKSRALGKSSAASEIVKAALALTITKTL